MAYLDHGESRLYYEVAGSGPTLVLSHGVGGNHASWFPQVTALADRYRIITWDHRGFGLSSDVEGLGRAGFMDDLVAILDRTCTEKAVLVGQSMGGGTSLAVACSHPERVAGLVMADSLSQATLPASITGPMAQNAAKTADLSQIERVLGATYQRQNPAGATLYSQIAGFNATTLRTLQGQMPSFTAADLAATGIPALFLVGEEDILFPPWAVRAYQCEVPSSQYIELARTGHSACYERPDAFNAALEGWLGLIDYAPGNESGPIDE